MLNVFRNNIFKCNHQKKVSIANIFFKNIVNNNKTFMNNFNKFSGVIASNQVSVFNQRKSIFRNNNNYSKQKNKNLISFNFLTKLLRLRRERRSRNVKIIKEIPKFYKNFMEGVSKSTSLNSEDKEKLTEKLKNYLTSHVQLINERRDKEFGDYLSDIVKDNYNVEKRKIDEEIFKMLANKYHFGNY